MVFLLEKVLDYFGIAERGENETTLEGLERDEKRNRIKGESVTTSLGESTDINGIVENKNPSYQLELNEAFLDSVAYNRADDYKHWRKGEDAYCFGAREIAVADGVGGCGDDGINPGPFARSMVVNGGCALKFLSAEQSLMEAYKKTVCAGIQGACTAIFGKIITENEKTMLEVANVGDSKLLILRDNQLVYSTVEQVDNAFNTPVQISDNYRLTFDREDHFYKFPIEHGDVIVTGTDGLFDNLFDKEIEELCQLHPNAKLEELCQIIGDSAHKASLDKHRTTPFSEHAKEWKIEDLAKGGGKPDDLTLIVSLVIFGQVDPLQESIFEYGPKDMIASLEREQEEEQTETIEEQIIQQLEDKTPDMTSIEVVEQAIIQAEVPIEAEPEKFESPYEVIRPLFCDIFEFEETHRTIEECHGECSIEPEAHQTENPVATQRMLSFALVHVLFGEEAYTEQSLTTDTWDENVDFPEHSPEVAMEELNQPNDTPQIYRDKKRKSRHTKPKSKIQGPRIHSMRTRSQMRKKEKLLELSLQMPENIERRTIVTRSMSRLTRFRNAPLLRHTN